MCVSACKKDMQNALSAPHKYQCRNFCDIHVLFCTDIHVLMYCMLSAHYNVCVGCMTCRGCTPLDVATAVIRDNTELCLALDDAHLRHVVSLLVTTTTIVTGGGGSVEQGGGGEEGREGTMGSVTCEWAPNGGEKCLDFLQCAVWADGMCMRIYVHTCTVYNACRSWSNTHVLSFIVCVDIML